MIYFKGSELSSDEFLHAYWMPFLHQVRQSVVAQQELDSLQQQCMELTAAWHGRPNISVLFATVIQMSGLTQTMAYPYSILPLKTSNDDYLVVYDKNIKDEFSKIFKSDLTADKPHLKLAIESSRFDLQTVTTEGEIVTIRPSGTKTTVKLIANAMPYQYMHTLTIAADGSVLDNTVCDIEKIVRELEAINPKNRNNMLPGEIIINGGQNSWTGSSIPQIQHMHYYEGSFEQFKLYNLCNAPIPIAAINGSVDLINIGSKPDAFFIKAITTSINTDQYLQFFINLRLQLVVEFGLSNIDFHFHIVPAKDGSYVTIMAPFAKLIKKIDPIHGELFINPETGEDNITKKVAQHLQLGNASKKWGIKFSDQELVEMCIQDGLGQLKALYDFTSKRGTKSYVEQYIQNFLRE